MPSHLDEFSAFIAETTEEKLPPPAIHAAKLIIADCVAAIVGGMAEPEMQRFAKTGTTPPDDPLRPDQARVLGVDRIADKARASLINGTAGTVLEMDEGHQFARGHPGMHVFPALLAEASNSSASGVNSCGPLSSAMISLHEPGWPLRCTLQHILTAPGGDRRGGRAGCLAQ